MLKRLRPGLDWSQQMAKDWLFSNLYHIPLAAGSLRYSMLLNVPVVRIFWKRGLQALRISLPETNRELSRRCTCSTCPFTISATVVPSQPVARSSAPTSVHTRATKRGCRVTCEKLQKDDRVIQRKCQCAFEARIARLHSNMTSSCGSNVTQSQPGVKRTTSCHEGAIKGAWRRLLGTTSGTQTAFVLHTQHWRTNSRELARASQWKIAHAYCYERCTRSKSSAVLTSDCTESFAQSLFSFPQVHELRFASWSIYDKWHYH